jgi:hypothetical protein
MVIRAPAGSCGICSVKDRRGQPGSRQQTNGILMFYRRLVRDYEHRPASSRSRVLWAMTSVMSRRLTGATIASWRTV